MKKTLLILIILIVSCKDGSKKSVKEDNKDEIKVEEKSISYPNFTVKLHAKIPLDDKLRLLYTEELGVKFDPQKIIFTDVKGSEDFQIITFILPDKNIFPARLRLDIPNRNLKGIYIKFLEIFHDENKIIIPHTDFIKYFYPNDYIQYNNENGYVEFINEEGKDYPFFISREPLHNELEFL